MCDYLSKSAEPCNDISPGQLWLVVLAEDCFRLCRMLCQCGSMWARRTIRRKSYSCCDLHVWWCCVEQKLWRRIVESPFWVQMSLSLVSMHGSWFHFDVGFPAITSKRFHLDFPARHFRWKWSTLFMPAVSKFVVHAILSSSAIPCSSWSKILIRMREDICAPDNKAIHTPSYRESKASTSETQFWQLQSIRT